MAIIIANIKAAAFTSVGLPEAFQRMPLADLGLCKMEVFHAGIRQGLQSLKEGGVPPSFLIIDDGWQQTGPDSVGSKKSSGRLEAKKDVRP